MDYQSFTLKYRPRVFEDVVGQDHVSRTIKNAVAAGHIHHAYLFTGPRGTGKTTTARILARALNCLAQDGPTPTPCGVCSMCVAIGTGRAMDIIEIDAASNRGIDDIKDLREKVKYSPAEGRVKLYILDECHMLTPPAWNALLKTLEEPPPHAYFALLTTELHLVPETILSRCQRFDFRAITTRDAAGALRRIADAEGLQVQDEALTAIARAAEGAMRDAQSIFEQVVAFSGGAITLDAVNQVLGVTEGETLMRIADTVARQDLPGVFVSVDELVADGKDLQRLSEDLTIFFRDLLRLALGSGAEAWLQLGPDGEARMRDMAQTIGSDRLLAAVHTLAELRTKMKNSSQHALLLELALAELCHPEAAAPRAPRQSARPAAAPVPAPVPVAPVAASAPVVPAAPSSAPVVAGAASAAAVGTPDTPVGPPAETPPPPAPTLSPGTVVSGDLTPELVWANWENLITQLKRMGHMPVGAFLKEAVPTGVKGDCVTLSFPANYKFHYSRVKEGYHETVTKALHALFGRPLKVECRLCAVGQDPLPPGTAAAALAETPPDPLPPIEVPEALSLAPPVVGTPDTPVGPVALTPAPDTPVGPVALTPAPDAVVGTPDTLVGPVALTPAPDAVVGTPDTLVGQDAAPPDKSVGRTDEAPLAQPAMPDLTNPHGPTQPPAEVPEPRDPQAVGMTTDEAVGQTLSLFDGAQEVLPDDKP